MPTARPKDDYETALAAYEGGALEESRQYVRALLHNNPRHVAGLNLAGVLAAQLLELDLALEFFDRALATDPGDPRAQFNKAGVLLLRCDWRAGWPLYESRSRLAELCAKNAPTVRAAWRGLEALAGKSILLRCEQGMGDTLQFCRYVPLVAQLGASVVLEVQRPLVSLLADLPGISRIVTQGATPPPCDFECPLMSLPLAFGTTAASIPQPGAYLVSDSAKVAEWRTRLGSAERLRIGLAWRGGNKGALGARRSLPLQLLLEQLPREHQYVSLQKDLRAEDHSALRGEPSVLEYSANLHDFSDTAALCACLDLVISVDTSVAHLSAALGRPTWIALPYSPGWRWLLERQDSPWYQTVVLYRQSRLGSWDDVCAQIAARLRAVSPHPLAG